MSEGKKPEKVETPDSKSEKDNAELSELLDSAFEDFLKTPSDGSKSEAISKEEPSNEEEVTSEQWTEDFIQQAASQFESNLVNFLGTNSDGSSLSPEQMQQKFQQMAEAAQQVIENPNITANSNDFASTISQTIQGLSQGAEGLQNPFSEQDMLNLLGGQGGGSNDFLPFMQGMMQSLLSKDVLYPSLKDILDRFPEWLETHKSTLSNDEYTRYENQMKLMEKVCTELEAESGTDSNEQKRERFEKVLNLMQKLQDYGQPPTDLVGDMGPSLPLDVQNQADPNQCALM